MEELKNEHLAPYSCNGLFGYFLGQKDIVTGIDFENNIISSLNNGNVLIKDFKPLLLPLSHLTEEIEVNGEKFVPVERLNQIFGINVKINPSYLNEGLVIEDIIGNDAVGTGYNVYQKLFEWHIDVFGLIEKGLAIDKTTL